MEKKRTTANLVFVLLVVLIICGGNGMGILIGGLLWKATERLSLAILAVVGITVIAFALAMALVALNHRSIARDALEKKAAEAAESAVTDGTSEPDESSAE